MLLDMSFAANLLLRQDRSPLAPSNPGPGAPISRTAPAANPHIERGSSLPPSLSIQGMGSVHLRPSCILCVPRPPQRGNVRSDRNRRRRSLTQHFSHGAQCVSVPCMHATSSGDLRQASDPGLSWTVLQSPTHDGGCPFSVADPCPRWKAARCKIGGGVALFFPLPYGGLVSSDGAEGIAIALTSSGVQGRIRTNPFLGRNRWRVLMV